MGAGLGLEATLPGSQSRWDSAHLHHTPPSSSGASTHCLLIRLNMPPSAPLHSGPTGFSMYLGLICPQPLQLRHLLPLEHRRQSIHSVFWLRSQSPCTALVGSLRLLLSHCPRTSLPPPPRCGFLVSLTPRKIHF